VESKIRLQIRMVKAFGVFSVAEDYFAIIRCHYLMKNIHYSSFMYFFTPTPRFYCWKPLRKAFSELLQMKLFFDERKEILDQLLQVL
jgi:hypothetical protein